MRKTVEEKNAKKGKDLKSKDAQQMARAMEPTKIQSKNMELSSSE